MRTATRVDLRQLAGAFEASYGLPQPRWDVIGRAIEEQVGGGDLGGEWAQVVEQWLHRLQDTLGSDYRILSSAHFL